MLIIDPEFQSLIPPLAPEELAQLEANILADGCRDPLVVWECLDESSDTDYIAAAENGGKVHCKYCRKDVTVTYGDMTIVCDDCGSGLSPSRYVSILIDGHNRYAICTKHGLPFETVAKEFADRESVMDWMDANQLGRRNLKPDQFTLLLGRRYNRTKAQRGGDRKSKGQIDTLIKTAAKLAAEHGVSEATVKRAGQYADAVDKLKDAAPEITQTINDGTAKPRRDVIKAAALLESHPEKAKEILQGNQSAADVTRDIKRQEIVANLESVGAMEAKELTGTFDVIVIDPPWPMVKIERDERPNQSAFDYPTMTLDEIAAIPMPASEDCHIWMWTTHKFLPIGWNILDSWGFKYVCTFVWHKPGGFQPVGLPQYNCEFALYGRKGSPKFIDTKALPTCFNAARGDHSEKPEEFYNVVRRVTAGRRVDMFNRRKIEGFSTWGKEAK